jgi:hypothetical protein
MSNKNLMAMDPDLWLSFMRAVGTETKPPSADEIADALERAVDALNTIGWVQSQEIRWTPASISGDMKVMGMCAMGAVRVGILGRETIEQNASRGSYPDLHGSSRVLMATCVKVLGEVAKKHITSFNDAKGRTKEEVIDVFNAAIKDLRNGNNPML